MDENCVPYQRKALYLLLTIPMIVLYVVIGIFLWQISRVYLAIYGVLFILVVFLQSYVCVYWQCPYVGRFAPCVGGFCLPSSQIARLFKNVKRSERIYNFVVSLAYIAFFGIILFPMYFIFQRSVGYLLIYIGIVLVYAVGFMGYICPVCATRHVCPGGQTSTKLRKMVFGK
ncbi:MAG: hypothetical protein JW908_16970 [Anaerolineales bacterium]|nr:hypothetical protein [Anaerolineales bacterium]